jgi:hypothetical protein
VLLNADATDLQIVANHGLAKKRKLCRGTDNQKSALSAAVSENHQEEAESRTFSCIRQMNPSSVVWQPACSFGERSAGNGNQPINALTGDSKV